MVSMVSLLLPILLSAVIVFIASSIIHMVLPYHRTDVRKLAKEDEVLEAVRRLNVPPGDYVAPHAGSPEGMKKPEFIDKMRRGPLLVMTVSPGSGPAMGKMLALWFVYLVVVSFFAAYIGSRVLPAGTPYLRVHQVVGCTAFLAYALALPQNSIWWRRNWGMTLKTMFDGLLYGLLTGGTFGWLWPQ